MRGLDTYYGRRITRITDDSDGNWFVELEGGVRVINNDPDTPKPDLPNSGEGLRFALSILGQADTQMVFMSDSNPPEEYRVTLNPFKYQIFDSDHAAIPWEPQAGGLSTTFIEQGHMVEPPPEPTERLVDGPESEPEATETKPKKAKPKKKD